ncbi:DUF1054 domain-containing protein [Paenibacillus yanchengensis]|uniref:UPF0637 protein ACFSJH_10645 n=1 Tax=Paenibacillus yanchengensis TaxID=2035833 RepID=A0ABW4YKI0_9BACL
MFTQTDFNVFRIPGLAERMSAIQQCIQPKFHSIGQSLSSGLTINLNKPMYLHIAKHARRTVNPPNDTWLAICDNKRGYKAHPHFQLGMFDDHLFVWLAFIYELPGKSRVADTMLHQLDDIVSQIPSNYVISLDHMKKDHLHVADLTTDDWEQLLIRFRDVKKCELLIGQKLLPSSDYLTNEQTLLAFAEQTYQQLLPLYTFGCRHARN